MKELDTATILKLLGPQPTVTTETPYERPKQTSKFMRLFDETFRCASRGCSSPTYRKLQGVPYCTTHMLALMDELLNKLATEAAPLQTFGEL